MKYLIPIAMLFMLAGTAWGTMWLYDDPSFFQTGSSSQAGNFRPASISILEIVDAPYFPLLGQGFYTDALPVQLSNSSNTVQISSSGAKTPSPTQITFSGHLENNSSMPRANRLCGLVRKAPGQP